MGRTDRPRETTPGRRDTSWPVTRSIRTSLSLLLILAAVPAVALAFWAAERERAATETRIQEAALGAARLAARLYDGRLQETEGLLRGLAELPAVAALDAARCDGVLGRLLAHTGYANLAAITPRGEVFCSAVPTPGAVNVADRPYFRRAVESGDFAIGGGHEGRISREAQVGLALPVRADGGRITAVLYAGLALDEFARTLASVPLPPGARALILDGSGTVLAVAPPSESALVGKSMAGLALWQRHERLEEGVDLGPGADGPERLVGFARFGPATLETGRLTAVVSVPAVVAAAEASRSFGLTLAATGLALLVALAGTLLLAELLVARRAEALAAATARLAAGDLSARSGLRHGGDELGRLAADFDRMAEALERDAERRAVLEVELRQAQKLEAVGRLAGGIAHDFNNLLTAILSYARFLHDELGPDDPRRADAAEILRAGDRAASLTSRLLAFSRRQPTAPRRVELRPLVAATEAMLRRLLGTGYELVVEDGEAPSVRADPAALEQALVNLVLNARDAQPGGGRITIGIGGAVRSPRTGGPPRDVAVLSVADEGVGMDEATCAHLFEPFFTTKEVGQGPGLGLAAVFGIVEEAGGEVTVESAPGRGSRFEIVLPAAEDGEGGPA